MATEHLLTPEQAGERLNIPIKTLAKARCTGSPAIPYIKIGRSVRYRAAELDAWLNANSHNVMGQG